MSKPWEHLRKPVETPIGNGSWRTSGGALVHRVVPGSPADAAGLAVDDVVVAVGRRLGSIGAAACFRVLPRAAARSRLLPS